MTVDRQKTTPFLLKLFYRTGGFHRTDEFSTSAPHPPPQHLQIYTWTSCTLHELSKLVHDALPTVLPAPAVGTRLAFRSIYPDLRGGPGGGHSSLLSGPNAIGAGQYLCRDLGSVVIGEGGMGAKGPDSVKSDDGDDDEMDGHGDAKDLSDGYSSDDSRRHGRGRGSRPRRRRADSRSLSPSRSRSRSRSRSLDSDRSRSASPHRRGHRSHRSHKSKSDRSAGAAGAVAKEPPSPTLLEAGFKPGDYISCAIFPPLPNGHVPGPPAPAASAVSRSMGGGGLGRGHGGDGHDFRGSRRGGGGGGGGGDDGGDGFGRGGRGGGSRLLNDDWRRGEAPPPPSDGYGRAGIGYAGLGDRDRDGGRRRPRGRRER